MNDACLMRRKFLFIFRTDSGNISLDVIYFLRTVP